MNLVLLLFIFSFIRSSYAKCRKYDFKLQLEPNDCVCNRPSHSLKGRVFNGTKLDKRDLPYVVSLYEEREIIDTLWRKKVLCSFCSGAIISPKFVLTSGHCIDLDDNNKNNYVGAGSSRVLEDMHRSDATSKKIQKFIRHPDYNETLPGKIASHDIGIVVLEDPFEFNLTIGVAPGCLFMETMEANILKHSPDLILAGYGRQNDDKYQCLKSLMFSRFKFLAIRRNRIEFSHPQTKTCKGDSGSPLLWENPVTNKMYIIGLLSTSYPNCTKGGGINGAVPVFNYIGWILGHVEGEICSTIDEIDDWFDEVEDEEEQDKS